MPSATFHLRPATAVDQRRIYALIWEGRINLLGLHWQKFIVAVADESGEVVGCGQIKPINDEVRELASLAVTRPWRKTGVARAIIQELQNQHQQTSPHPLWLMCEARLVPFYTQFQFQEIHDYAQMPPHFARAKWLVSGFLRLLRQKNYLAVMVWDNERGES